MGSFAPDLRVFEKKEEANGAPAENKVEEV